MAKKAKGKAAVEAEPEKKSAKKHERKAKPSEAELLERGRSLAASYLVQRDGMDEDTAKMVIEGMEPEQVNELITEANSAVIGRTSEPVDDSIPEFTEFNDLAEHQDFAGWCLQVVEAGKRKNEAEEEYKAIKAQMFEAMREAGVKLDQPIAAFGNRFTPYVGESSNLDKTLLIEAGVDIDLINKGYKKSKYNDVRIYVPKQKGGA